MVSSTDSFAPVSTGITFTSLQWRQVMSDSTLVRTSNRLGPCHIVTEVSLCRLLCYILLALSRPVHILSSPLPHSHICHLFPRRPFPSFPLTNCSQSLAGQHHTQHNRYLFPFSKASKLSRSVRHTWPSTGKMGRKSQSWRALV